MTIRSNFLKFTWLTVISFFFIGNVFAELEKFYIYKNPKKKMHGVYLESLVPFNKGYKELTQAEKEEVKKHYPELSSSSQPPYPVKGMKHLYTALINAQMKRGRPHPAVGGLFPVPRERGTFRRGNLKLVAKISKDGSVSNINVLEYPSKRIKKIMVRKVLKTQFTPAIVDGETVDMDFRLQIRSNGGSLGSSAIDTRFTVSEEWNLGVE